MHNLQIGNVLAYSWGYDQTNVYFYQVVRRSDKSVWLQRIAGESILGTEGFMSDKVRPVLNHFISDDVIRKIVRNDCVGFDHGIGSLVAGDRSYYHSWYA